MRELLGKPSAVALTVALVAGMVVVAGVQRTHGGDWTGPFLVGESAARAASWPIQVSSRPGSDGYDGQFFLALAFDPLLRTPLAETLDDAEYRAHRITWSAAAWLLGAGNDSLRVLFLYLLLVAGVSALGFLLADWAVRHGGSAWWGLPGALGLGSWVCLQRMLGDVLMAALLVVVAVAISRLTKHGDLLAALAFTLAALQKETALLALPLLALPLLRRRGVAALAWLAPPLLATAGWWWLVDTAVATTGSFSLSIPFAPPGRGFATALGEALGRTADPLRLAKDLSFLGLHALAVALGLGVGWQQFVRAFRGRLPAGLPAAVGLLALLGVFLSSHVWGEPWAYARVLLPLLTLELLLALEVAREEASSLVPRLAKWVVLTSFAGGLLFALRNLLAAAP